MTGNAAPSLGDYPLRRGVSGEGGIGGVGFGSSSGGAGAVQWLSSGTGVLPSSHAMQGHTHCGTLIVPACHHHCDVLHGLWRKFGCKPSGPRGCCLGHTLDPITYFPPFLNFVKQLQGPFFITAVPAIGQWKGGDCSSMLSTFVFRRSGGGIGFPPQNPAAHWHRLSWMPSFLKGLASFGGLHGPFRAAIGLPCPPLTPW